MQKLLEKRVMMTSLTNRQQLFQINNFRYRPCQKRQWYFDETRLIPLENEGQLDPRRKRSMQNREILEIAEIKLFIHENLPYGNVLGS